MKVTLEFDNEEAAENFINWWLNEGEQISEFQTETRDNYQKYMRIIGNGIFENDICDICINELEACVCMEDQ